jgi:hypothetical protein
MNLFAGMEKKSQLEVRVFSAMRLGDSNKIRCFGEERVVFFYHGEARRRILPLEARRTQRSTEKKV